MSDQTINEVNKSGGSYNRDLKQESNSMKGSACSAAAAAAPESRTNSFLEIMTALRTQTVMHGIKNSLEKRKEAAKAAQGRKQIG